MADTTELAVHDPSANIGSHLTRMYNTGKVVGPHRHLSAERERLLGLTWQHFDVKQLGSTLGAEIAGLDLRDELSPEVVAELRQALYDYKVIFFRDQPLNGEQHVAFARRFGALEVHPFIPPNEALPELVHFQKGAEVGGYENSWHHDVTWRATPSMGAVLRSVTVPPVGGDTLFADMYAAYDGLPDEVKARIDTMTAVHDFMKSFGRMVPEDKLAETRAKYPLVEHPVVCTHEGTGRRHLYVNHNFVDHLVGLEPDESQELLSFLCAQADYPEYQCRFHWEPDSIAFWDNRAVQHYASSDYHPAVRVMERASIVGNRPAA